MSTRSLSLLGLARIVGLASASLAAASCNSVLGIDEPTDKPPPIVIGPTTTGGSQSSSGVTSSVTNGAATVTTGSTPPPDAAAPLPPATHPWAEWPMPNPPSTNLPNPQSYTAGTKPGVVRDNVTLLEWQQVIDDGSYSWADAVRYCAALDLAGTGWRLPSRIELLSIVDHTVPYPRIDSIVFPKTPGSHFWTASPLADGSGRAWFVDFGFVGGFAYDGELSELDRVRCVRSPGTDSPGDRYTTDDDTALDAKTGLTWQRAVAVGTYGWNEANGYCDSLVLGASPAWRLPSVKELQTLVDESKAMPAVDPNVFPETPADYFWTSSTVVGFATFGWAVSFVDGLSYYFDMGRNNTLVRCVH